MVYLDNRTLRRSFWEQLNIKIRIGSLQFDIMLDATFVPNRVERNLTSHKHSAFEMHAIISGAGVLAIGDSEFDMLPGSLHLIGPNVFHSFRPDEGASFVRSTMKFSFHSSPLSDAWYPRSESEQIADSLSNVTYRQFRDVDSNRKIILLMEEIRSEIETPSTGAYANVQSLFSQLIVQVVRLLHPDGKRNESSPFPQRIHDEMRFRIIDLFFSHYRQSLTIEMLAEQLNLSTKQANRVLKQYYNMSFKQKLLDNRIEVSKELLRMSGMSVQQISEEVGYRATPHFRQLFVQRTGMTPEQYRVHHGHLGVSIADKR
ncbi:MAG: AraC family transcriptional regulator [Paenibacillus sp.]|uniref:Helix-turn-helix domain-containing protein n=1 Tax=Paenibacillus hemerocallicola TaxID=1172614 RepID=A0A5C4T3V6_9BACL|nr:AraC family transcriptional regulator [Paenibacillus hemerocallicola]MDF2661162.1 AraC family transcriptional regulator [Paenibacillus sp.]TNJ63754.1 helix-turn-helix domain-containing protein [Paenibacillus hemerocallicola]